MARHILSFSATGKPLPAPDQIFEWFRQNRFSLAQFKKGEFEITVGGSQPIFHRIQQHRGYDTFYRPAYGGALLIFEIHIGAERIDLEAYSPMMLFGFIPKEVSFKEHAGWLTRYRKEGYQALQAFTTFIEA